MSAKLVHEVGIDTKELIVLTGLPDPSVHYQKILPTVLPSTDVPQVIGGEAAVKHRSDEFHRCHIRSRSVELDVMGWFERVKDSRGTVDQFTHERGARSPCRHDENLFHRLYKKKKKT